MSNTDKAARQNVQQKATQEFIGTQSEESLLIVVSGIAPAECDLVIREGNEPVFGNCYAMSVGAKVTKHLIRAPERRSAIDHPAWTIKLPDQAPKESGLSQPVE